MLRGWKFLDVTVRRGSTRFRTGRFRMPSFWMTCLRVTCFRVTRGSVILAASFPRRNRPISLKFSGARRSGNRRFAVIYACPEIRVVASFLHVGSLRRNGLDQEAWLTHAITQTLSESERAMIRIAAQLIDRLAAIAD